MPVSRLLVLASAAALVHVAAALGQGTPGSAFRDCPECPEMVVIPAGRFIMGAAPGEEEREGVPERFRGRAEPRAEIEVASFALGRFEVAVGEFAAFMDQTRHLVFTGNCRTAFWVLNSKLDWRNPGFAQTGRHPVVCVSRSDAIAYVDWLRRKTGKAYRLPSEAEWEYAARAGAETSRPWGDSAADACRHANVAGYPCSHGFTAAAPIGSFAPNRFGVYDMIGNVWEFLEDCWNETLAGMPKNGRARRDGDCIYRVQRGGAWHGDAWQARSATRWLGTHGAQAVILGFRVARTP